MKVVVVAAELLVILFGANCIALVLDEYAASWLAALRPSTAAATARVSATPHDWTDALRAIRERNIFNHGEPSPDDEPEGQEIVIPAGACTLPIEATGAVLVRATPELSLAALRDRGSGRIDVFQIGDDVAPGATLAAVLANDDGGLDGVEVAFSDGHRERCDARPGASATTSAPPPPGVSGPAAAAGRAVVSSAEVAKLYADGFTTIASQMRALPIDGGWKLSGVPTDSVLAAAGIHSGDVVKRVNGHEVRTAQDALSLVGLLRNERDVTVDLTRDGRPTTLEVAIR